MNSKETTRAALLMRKAAEYILEYWAEGTVIYDGCDCDGYCLAEDLRSAADALEEQS